MNQRESRLQNGNRVLVLAIGNEIMGDDAAGLIAARELRKHYHSKVDILEAHTAGFTLLDILEGYDKALLLDTVYNENSRVHKIRELTRNDLAVNTSMSPHYAGLPELIRLSEKLYMKFPDELRAFVMEIHEKGVLREGLTMEAKALIPDFVEKASSVLDEWLLTDAFNVNMVEEQVI